MIHPESKILVTGGHGFVGSHLVDRLKALGYKNIVAPTHQECDFRNQEAVRRLFDQKKFDLIFHLAASVGGIGANQKRPADFFTDNALMGIHLIDTAAKANCARFVLIGTICAYPKFAPLPFKEESLWEGYPEETNAPYGVAKRSLVVAAQAYRQQYGFNYVALFPTNLYGPRDDFDLDNSHVIPALIRKCEEAREKDERTIHLWGTGEPSRDFLYVADAVEAMILAAKEEGIEGEILNLGSEQEIKVRDLAQLVAKVTGYSGTFMWDSKKPDGQPRRCVSNEKCRRLLKFSPRYPLEKGIEATVNWYREAFRTHR